MPISPLPVVSRIAERPQRICDRCEQLPQHIGPQELHCWFPTAHVAGKTRGILREHAVAVRESVGSGMVFQLDDFVRARVIDALEQGLSDVEREDTRALLVDVGRTPGLEDLARVEPLGRTLGRLGSAWLIDMLHDGRLTSHFQPIVDVRHPTTIYAHEALLRGVQADGSFVPPGQLFGAARQAGLLFQLDLAARRSAIAAAAAVRLRSVLFVNFTPTAIYDPSNCLRSTVAAVDAAGLQRRNIVFEIVETERATDPMHLRRILDYYRGAGFRVAMDDVGSGYSSLNLIHLLRPDIIKLDMELIRDVHLDPYKARIASKLLGIAQELGIDTLVEGVECAEEFAWVQSQGATWVQGYYFGRPSAQPSPCSVERRAVA